jgi:glycosyltransferase involved in cell wall biosynthesis
MKPFSAVIITYNEEKNIGRCLESIKDIADEIVVVDSFSTDRTKEICLSYGAVFIEHPFEGFIEKKNFALDKATHQYALSLDADEALDDVLRNNILAEKEKSFPFDSYEMNRMSLFCGQWIKHGSWYPDKKIRLINRQKARWGGTNPHDKMIVQSGASKKHLKGDILHKAYNSLEEIILQTNKLTSIQSLAMYQQGKRSGVIKLVLNPFAAFFSGYFIKRGFLDGYNGFLIARYASYATFIKYSKLLHLQKKGGK